MVTGQAQIAPKPDFGNAGGNWSSEGWYVPVYYCTFDEGDRIRPKDKIEIIRPLLQTKYAPLRPTGDGKQTAYLAEVPEQLAAVLIELIGQPFLQAFEAVSDFPSVPGDDDPPQEDLEHLGPTFKEQLIRARRGQGVFRSNVLLRESSCRVTGVGDPKHLRASHIKPWRTSTDHEKLNGHNGLLLSPHVDHLFDKGYLSFSNDERLLVVDEVRGDLLDRWGIKSGTKVGEFNREQQAFLEFHRVEVFKGPWP